MSGIWVKVWADLWSNKIRTFLAVLSIAAGVFAVGAMFGMSDLLKTGMDTSHQASTPSHILIYLTDYIDQDTAIRLEKIEGVEKIEVANTVSVRYKINPEDEWKTGDLVMRDDYDDQKFDIYQLKEGKWPREKKFAIERLSSQFYGINIGDQLIFEVNDREKIFDIASKVRHPFVPPPQFGGEAVFFTDAEGMVYFGVEEGEFSELRIRVTPYSLDLSKEIATEIKDRLGKEDIAVAVTFYQDPEKHWGGAIMDGILLVFRVLALVSLAASVVLVLNTLNAIITQQIDQIGIIKAIGGTTGTIIRIYLTVVLIYGLLALLIAFPLSSLVAYGMTRQFLNYFNIDYEVFQISTRATIYQVISSIIVPLLAALLPVMNGATTTVREAISSYGLGGGKFGSSWLDRFVERLGQRLLSASYAMALGNMFRRKGRLILTQVTLITAGTMFLMVMCLSASVSLTLDNEFARNDYDTALFFEDEERIDRVVALAKSLDGVETAEVRYSHSASIFKEGQRTNEAGIGTGLAGLPAGSNIFKPLIVAGRWLQPSDGRAIVISLDTAKDNNIKLGETLTLDLSELGKDDWQVIGFYQNIFGGFGSYDTIYANQEAVFKATKKHNRGSNIFIRTHIRTKNYVEALTDHLKELYEAEHIKVEDTDTIFETRQEANSQFDITINMLLAMAVIMAIVGGVGLMGALSISVVERIREIGVMRAIGAHTPTILGMFIMEGVLQGLFSWLLATPISFVLGQPLANALGQALFDANLDFQYNYNAVIVWLVIILVISILASIIPARNATRISVRDSLAYQ
jgi:putative ABC transport system permease protein